LGEGLGQYTHAAAAAAAAAAALAVDLLLCIPQVWEVCGRLLLCAAISCLLAVLVAALVMPTLASEQVIDFLYHISC
jgi:hypothetical protein